MDGKEWADSTEHGVAENVAPTSTVQHDPLCKAASLWVAVIENGGSLPHKFIDYCPTCDLIAKVRADELRHPSEDGWMSVRAILAWEDQVRADEQQQVARRLTAHHAKGCIGGKSGLGCGCGLWADIMTSSVEQP